MADQEQQLAPGLVGKYIQPTGDNRAAFVGRQEVQNVGLKTEAVLELPAKERGRPGQKQRPDQRQAKESRAHQNSPVRAPIT